MTCRKIMTCARKLLRDPQGGPHSCILSSAEAEDEERAGYILAAAISEMADTDDEYRRSMGLPSRAAAEAISVDADDDFPLSARFAHPAAYYLAAMLAADEYPELSDTLFDRFSDGMAAIRASLPATLGKTEDVYG